MELGVSRMPEANHVWVGAKGTWKQCSGVARSRAGRWLSPTSTNWEFIASQPLASGWPFPAWPELGRGFPSLRWQQQSVAWVTECLPVRGEGWRWEQGIPGCQRAIFLHLHRALILFEFIAKFTLHYPPKPGQAWVRPLSHPIQELLHWTTLALFLFFLLTSPGFLEEQPLKKS